MAPAAIARRQIPAKICSASPFLTNQSTKHGPSIFSATFVSANVLHRWTLACAVWVGSLECSHSFGH